MDVEFDSIQVMVFCTCMIVLFISMFFGYTVVKDLS